MLNPGLAVIIERRRLKIQTYKKKQMLLDKSFQLIFAIVAWTIARALSGALIP